MGFMTRIIQWVGYAGIIAGLASLASAIFGTFRMEYIGIALPHELPGAIAILAAGVVVTLIGTLLGRRTGCGCCGGGGD